MTNQTQTLPRIWDKEMDTIIENSWKEITKGESTYETPSKYAYFSIGFKAAVLELQKMGVFRYDYQEPRKPYEPIKPEPQNLPEIRSRNSSPYDASGRVKVE